MFFSLACTLSTCLCLQRRRRRRWTLNTRYILCGDVTRTMDRWNESIRGQRKGKERKKNIMRFLIQCLLLPIINICKTVKCVRFSCFPAVSLFLIHITAIIIVYIKRYNVKQFFVVAVAVDGDEKTITIIILIMIIIIRRRRIKANIHCYNY